MAPSELLVPFPSSLEPFRAHCDYGYSPLKTVTGSIPYGWPSKLNSSFAWTGKSFNADEEFTYTLSAEENKEIDAALQYFKELGLDGYEANQSTFPLPTLQNQLHRLVAELHEGRGFFAIRGLDPKNYSMEDNLVIYLGVSSYIGEKRGRQDDRGSMFSHVRQAKMMKASQNDRPIKDSNLGSAFHNDAFCDILAMQTHSCAAKGGNHILTPSWTIYNELGATRPDVLELLAKPYWPFDVRGRLYQPLPRPVFYYHNDRLITHMLPEALLGVSDIPRPAGLPSMTPSQVEALETVQMLAVKHQLVLSMQPGDLTFVNNFALMHAREPFVDDEASGKTRYMVRLWLRNETRRWELPEQLERGNRVVFDDETVEECWNVRPMPRLSFEIRERFTP